MASCDRREGPELCERAVSSNAQNCTIWSWKGKRSGLAVADTLALDKELRVQVIEDIGIVLVAGITSL